MASRNLRARKNGHVDAHRRVIDDLREAFLGLEAGRKKALAQKYGPIKIWLEKKPNTRWMENAFRC